MVTPPKLLSSYGHTFRAIVTYVRYPNQFSDFYYYLYVFLEDLCIFYLNVLIVERKYTVHM